MADISLTASMRSNLLSLQNTTELMDRTQNRLSTGKKVNSALDNPSSFFTARSLNNRASDLMGLLDGMGQALQTLKAAEQGLESLTALVEQAQAVGEQALEAVNAGGSGSSASGVTVTGTMTFGTTNTVAGADRAGGAVASAWKSGSLQKTGTVEVTVGNGTTYSIQLTAGMSSDDIVDAFNGVDGVTASIDSDNKLVISSNDEVEIRDAVGTTVALATMFGIEGSKSADSLTLDFGQLAAKFFAGVNGNAAGAETTFDKMWKKTITAADKFTFTFNYGGVTEKAIITAKELTAIGIGTSKDAEVKALIKGKITEVAAQLSGVSVSTDTSGNLTISTDGTKELTITSAEAGVGKDADGALYNVATLLGIEGTITADSSSSTDNSSFVSQYNDLLSQIDSLVGDAGYKGINLLNGSNLTVTFNEDSTSTLSLTGVTYNASGLSLSTISGAWDNTTDVQAAIDATKAAIDTLRSQAEVFGRNGSVIQTRQDFTENMVNTLVEGSDKLTLADMNEEGANMLALQTRQSLATTSLSMAAQASQSVLSLFR